MIEFGDVEKVIQFKNKHTAKLTASLNNKIDEYDHIQDIIYEIDMETKIEYSVINYNLNIWYWIMNEVKKIFDFIWAAFGWPYANKTKIVTQVQSFNW